MNKIESMILIPKRREVVVQYKDGSRSTIPIFPSDQFLLRTISSNNVPLSINNLKADQAYANFISTFGLILIVFVGISFLIALASKNINSTFNFLSRNNLINPSFNNDTNFDDIAGVEEISSELSEVVDFLIDSKKLKKLGARAPKGILISGPPGTGKTLLARAIAGEAKVPFYNVSASEFVELFIGVGASRVRNLFIAAKQNKPCIIFIDEIESIGRKRGGGIGSGNDEREQTLNQLLTQMDGFEENSGIIVLAATNREDVVDEALLRPGRFDRKIYLSLPDLKARQDILNLHSLSYPLSQGVSIFTLAKNTIGFSGAQLKNLLNEAAIIAAQRNNSDIEANDIERALDRITLGTINKCINTEHKTNIAYRQMSQALISHLVNYPEKIYKVSLLPRRNKAGITKFIDSENIQDEQLFTKSFLHKRIKILLAPRAAEILVFGQKEITSLSAIDFGNVFKIIKSMIEKYGFSNLGPLYIENTNTPNLIINTIRSKKSLISQSISSKIDNEIIYIANNLLNDAITLLQTNKAVLDKLVEELLIKETIEQGHFYNIIHRQQKINNGIL